MRFTLVLSLLWAAAAAAQDDAARMEARLLLREGNVLYEKGEYAAALHRYKGAYGKLQSPKILLNIGTTLRRLNRDNEAAEAYEIYLSRVGLEVPAEKKAQVREALDEINQKVGRLRIEVNVEGATVRLDGELKGASPLGAPVRVDPGLHRIEAERDGYHPDTKDVEIAAGDIDLVVLRLEQIRPPPPTDPVPPPPPPAPPLPVASPPPSPAPVTVPRLEPVIRDSESDIGRSFSHAWQLSLAVRQDVVLRTDELGAFTGVGLGFGLGDYVELSLWYLRGRGNGGRGTVTAFALPDGRLKPLVVVGMTGLDVQGFGFEPLFHGGGGLAIDLTRRVGLMIEGAYERFLVSLEEPRIDDGRFLASLSVCARIWE